MIFKAYVEAVSGTSIKADGKWLTSIGNKPVKVGDFVWTDGRCVFGHFPSPSHPFVPTFKTDDICLPVLREPYSSLDFNSFALSDKFSTLHRDRRVNRNANTHFFFLAGRSNSKKQFALIRSPNSHNLNIVDATMTSDGNIFSAAAFKNWYYSYPDLTFHPSTGPFFNGNDIVCDVHDAVQAFFPDFHEEGAPSDDDWWADKTFRILGVSNACVDRDGNCFAIAEVHYVRGLTPPDPDLSHHNYEVGNTWQEGDVFLFIKNQQATLMRRSVSTFYGYDPENPKTPEEFAAIRRGDDGVRIAHTSYQPFTPYSLFLPLKNEGYGGWFSFDFDFYTDDLIFHGVKFFDANFNFLFSLSQEDFFAVERVASLSRFDTQIFRYGLPQFDICKLNTDDFLILVRRQLVYSYYDNVAFIFRFRHHSLSLVFYNHSDSPQRLFSVSTVSKKQWRHILNTFSKGVSQSDFFIRA